jgi:DNA-binding NarL/FixJ family response regulator/AraC-like DNA-binding protein
MRTIMIAEDEAIVRIGLQTIIDWNRHGFELVGAYSNGRQAWEAIRVSPPDILLTDIRMPEMDGLELIRRIREENLDMHIVILSGYDDFDYTRKAIQLQVQDYLIKHKLDPSEIIDILNALPQRAQPPAAANRGDSIEEEKERLLNMTREWAPSREAETAEQDGARSLPLLKLKLAGIDPDPRLVWIAMRPKPSNKAYLTSELRAAAMLLADIVKRFDRYVFLGQDKELFHAIGIYPAGEAGEAAQAVKKWVEEELVPPLRDKLNMEFQMGIGSIGGGLERLGRSRHDAEQALRMSFYGGGGIYCTGELGEHGGLRNLTQSEWLRDLKQAKAYLGNEDFAGAIAWIRGQHARMAAGIDPADAVRFCRMVIHQCIDLVMERYQLDLLSAEGPLQAEKHPLTSLEAAASWSELADLTAAFLETAGDAVSEMRSRNDWLGKAVAYIEANYAKPFRQEDVAKHVNLSVNYFSYRFRQETGSSFSDFVARKRINKAIELVRRNEELSTEAIAEMVGFANPNYFIRLFKKITGSTWSEFKRKK